MKKYASFIFLLLAMNGFVTAQNPVTDSLKRELIVAPDDTIRSSILNELARFYRVNRPDSGIYFGNKAWELARKIRFPEGEIIAMYCVVNSYNNIGNDAKALQIALEGIRIADENNLSEKKGPLFSQLGHIHVKSMHYSEAISYFRKSKSSFYADNEHVAAAIRQDYIGTVWLRLNNLDSAEYYSQSANDSLIRLNVKSGIQSIPLLNLGKIQLEKGDTSLAETYFKESVSKSEGQARSVHLNSIYSIAQFYQRTNRPDSALHYAIRLLEIAKDGNFYKKIIDASILLSNIYEKNDLQKALNYNKMATTYKDSIFDLARLTTLQNLIDFDEQDRQHELESAKAEFQNQVQRIWIFGIAAALISAIVLTLVLYRNNKNKQKSNTLLKEQKEEIQVTLEKLESTQSQLIHSEKMASLGELTAGIAHEIQNPLNFVNNFSEVSEELADELEEEVQKPDSDKSLLLEIARDISQNQEKIHHHGSHASSIVKGMLEHSRTSTGEKELTDLNVLADEYLRLAYHGLRAKDKSFNADFKSKFDESLPKTNVIPQDIGRVLLNLINNAFYAVDKKSKEGIDGYKPAVIISTKKHEKSIEICVKDNGAGIPDNIKDKIFQPFFTTKPTGSGTGLGLSLSYDIVKAHGGTLKVEKEDGTIFIILIPTT